MANKALATRQKMRVTAPPSKPRNPVAVAAKLRAAGPHAKGPGPERAAAKRALKKAKLEPEE
jgi:hypothetical protein